MNTSSDYDAFAQDFSQTRTKPWPEFDIFMPHLKKGDRVLDLGCGDGRLRGFITKALVREGDYFGMDISGGMLEIARKNFPRENFFRQDFSERWPFGADNFDFVVSIAAFHHLLSKKEQLAFLEECHRVMKPGGMIFLTTWKLPKKHFWPNILKGRFKNWLIPFGNNKHPRTYRRVSDRELKSLLTKAGFKVEDARLFREKNYIILAKKH